MLTNVPALWNGQANIWWIIQSFHTSHDKSPVETKASRYSMCWQRPLGSLWWNGNQTHGLSGADTLSVLVMNELPPLFKTNNETHCLGHLAVQWQRHSQHVSNATRRMKMNFTVFGCLFLRLLQLPIHFWTCKYFCRIWFPHSHYELFISYYSSFYPYNYLTHLN